MASCRFRSRIRQQHVGREVAASRPLREEPGVGRRRRARRDMTAGEQRTPAEVHRAFRQARPIEEHDRAERTPVEPRLRARVDRVPRRGRQRIVDGQRRFAFADVDDIRDVCLVARIREQEVRLEEGVLRPLGEVPRQPGPSSVAFSVCDPYPEASHLIVRSTTIGSPVVELTMVENARPLRARRSRPARIVVRDVGSSSRVTRDDARRSGAETRSTPGRPRRADWPAGGRCRRTSRSRPPSGSTARIGSTTSTTNACVAVERASATLSVIVVVPSAPATGVIVSRGGPDVPSRPPTTTS